MLILLFFYLIVGLIQQHLQGRFGRRVVLEHGVVTVIGILIIAFGLGG